MMSEEVLKEIEEWGRKLLSPEEVAVIVGVDREKFLLDIQEQDTAICKAYWAGVYRTKAELNESVIKLARQGSSPAQTEVTKLLKQVGMESVKHH
jgi:hypothetical protein